MSCLAGNPTIHQEMCPVYNDDRGAKEVWFIRVAFFYLGKIHFPFSLWVSGVFSIKFFITRFESLDQADCCQTSCTSCLKVGLYVNGE